MACKGLGSTAGQFRMPFVQSPCQRASGKHLHAAYSINIRGASVFAAMFTGIA